MTREAKTILIVLLSGFLVVGGLFAYEVLAEEGPETDQVAVPEISGTETSIHKEIEQKIDALKNKPFNPQSYSIFMTEINSYYTNGSYTESIKISLENRLLDVYSQQVYAEAEKFLTGRTANSAAVKSLLAQVKQNGGNTQKISYYENQIRYYHYYSFSLPQKVSKFISKGITNYSDEEYLQFKEEVNNMANLEGKYKTAKFQNIKSALIYNLGEFNMAYHIPTYKPEYQNL